MFAINILLQTLKLIIIKFYIHFWILRRSCLITMLMKLQKISYNMQSKYIHKNVL